MAALLYRGWPDQMESVQWRDVDSREAWRREYGLRVPVLMRGERVVSELIPDRDALTRSFGRPAVPV